MDSTELALNEMADAIAFITARVNDDKEGALAIFDNVDSPAQLMLSITDFAISLLTIEAERLRLQPLKLLRTMSRIMMVLPDEVRDMMKKGYDDGH